MYILFQGDYKSHKRIGVSIMSPYEKSTPKPHPDGYPTDPQTLGEHIKKRRMDLRMFQAEVARLLKVSEDCVCYWENGRNNPRLYQYPVIIAFLGYYPFDHETATLGGKIKRYKHEHGLSNEKLAKVLGVDEGTIANWERNKRLPLARSLDIVLSIIVNKNAAH
jgi:DNA-binding transcriptional regulator YiaG